ncbi:hypothetical protein L873DRAFT_915119 [Choiromyces venosus 120613-1]|uniref:Uncharacterized protein n=1 Tax=Choiromyces venosus 120613-1 TaxID=1336337 RepID=A0A3N4JM17_9PEZI|nr:hypothetical protein L873DRAFT_915119 [Choiromyces venosus 120613-1]
MMMRLFLLCDLNFSVRPSPLFAVQMLRVSSVFVCCSGNLLHAPSLFTPFEPGSGGCEGGRE